MKTSLLLPDLHLGSHDDRALRVALRIAEITEPDEVVILGDWIDGHDFNSHGSSDRREAKQAGYMSEIDMCNEILDWLQALPSVKRVVYVEGNHEFRVERFLTNQGNKFIRKQGDAFLPRELLSKGRKDFVWVDYNQPGKAPFIELAPGVVACHGLSTAKHAAATHLTKVPGYSVIHGHTHRAQTHYTRCPVTNRLLFGHSPGTLAQLQPLWLTGASNWTQGVSILAQRGQLSSLTHFQIEDGKALIGRELINAGPKGSMIKGIA